MTDRCRLDLARAAKDDAARTRGRMAGTRTSGNDLKPHARRRRHPRTRRTSVRFTAHDVREALLAIGPAPLSQLISHLNPHRGGESRAFRQLVDGMLRAGDLALNRHGVYRLAADDTVAGKVVRADRALMLKRDDGERLPVAGGVPVRPGDRAAGVVQGREVRIATVLEPAPETVVGLLYVRPRAAYVDSLDPDLKGRIDLVSPTSARTGAIVEVEILAVTSTEVQGRVVRVIEAGNEAARAAEALLAAHRIPREWRSDPARLNLPQAVGQDDITGRRDLRDIPLVTIDGADARDFDDAVFAEPKRRGGWRLVVAIADVAHYVKARSGLDRDARERGNSVYLPDRVVPMLPEALSNGICSLVPNEDRLAVVCDMQVSARGRVSSYAFYDAVIHSHARLTYDAVQALLSDGTSGRPRRRVRVREGPSRRVPGAPNAARRAWRVGFRCPRDHASTRRGPARGRRCREANGCPPADRRSDDRGQRRGRTPSRGHAPRSPRATTARLPGPRAAGAGQA